MFAIYEQSGGQLGLFEAQEEDDEFVDLNEAEEMLRKLRKDEPAEFERIASLRDGIRTGRASTQKGVYVFCQADYKDTGGRRIGPSYQQLFLVSPAGEIVSRDIPRVLGAIRCGPELEGQPLPDGYNQAVMRVQRQFVEEVKHRDAERDHTMSLTQGQRYVLREIRVLFGQTNDEDRKAQLNILERAFRIPPTGAVNQELNRIRRNGVVGQTLLKSLTSVCNQHDMGKWLDQPSALLRERPIPRIICSEALT